MSKNPLGHFSCLVGIIAHTEEPFQVPVVRWHNMCLRFSIAERPVFGYSQECLGVQALGCLVLAGHCVLFCITMCVVLFERCILLRSSSNGVQCDCQVGWLAHRVSDSECLCTCWPTHEGLMGRPTRAQWADPRGCLPACLQTRMPCMPAYRRAKPNQTK